MPRFVTMQLFSSPLILKHNEGTFRRRVEQSFENGDDNCRRCTYGFCVASQLILPLLLHSVLFSSPRQNVSFHLVYPLHSKSLSGRVQQGEAPSLNSGECSTLVQRLSGLSQKTNYDHEDAYPVNLLRNVGRKNCRTQFVLVVDVDLMVNAGMCGGYCFPSIRVTGCGNRLILTPA